MRLRIIAGFAAVALSLVAATIGTAPSAGAVPTWAPAATATIHPGVQTRTAGAQCTANFIFTDAAGAVYIGQAAHCASLGGQTQTNGCTTPSRAIGTAVTIAGAEHPGTLAYSSWVAMQVAGETNADRCAHNDFALVRIDSRDVARVNPSVPHWGGPTGLNTTGLDALSQVYTYGNSSLRQGLTVLSPKTGISQETDANGWNHPAINLPAVDVPGDSGSGLLDASGQATGVLSTVSVGFPGGVRSNYSDVSRALAYANAHGMTGVTPVDGTEPFDPDQLPLGI